MRYCWLLLTTLFFINTAYAAQEKTMYDPVKAHKEAKEQRYQERKKKKQADVSRMYFFVKHVDEVGTPEKEKLDIYLRGLQDGYSTNQFMQKNTLGMTWFCARPSILSRMNGEKTAENIIKWVYQTYPERFKGDAIYASSSAALAYGLQYKHPCEGVPMARIPGYKY